MRLVDAVAIVVVGALVVASLVYLFQRIAETRARAAARWSVRSRSLAGNKLAVQVERYGEPPQVVAELRTGEPDFEERLWQAEERAAELAATLNASYPANER